MAIMRFTASADTTITNAYRSSLLDNQRATGSNMGAADVLEVFSIYSQASASSGELSRVLLKFPTTDISSSRASGDIPASGSVNFFLRMFNAKHAATTPSDYTMQVVPVSQSWEEGYGLDMDEYKDKTKDGVGSNWMNATSTTRWIGTKATLADAIDTTGIAAGDQFTMTVPTDAGGDGVAYKFLFDTTTNIDANEETNTFGISTQRISDDADAAAIVAKAINGTADSKYKYGANNHDEGSFLAAGTIGLTATSAGSKVTLIMDTAGPDGNVANVLAANTGFESDLLLESTFTGGKNHVGGTFDYEPAYSVSFGSGDEDLEVDITELVEEWVANGDSTPPGDDRENYGIAVFLSSNYEAFHSSSALTTTDDVVTGVPTDGVLLHNVTGSKRSYYTKKFFSRSTEFFFKRPLIEARWDSSLKDDRANFYASSSMTDESGSMNTLYLYNLVRGQYKNIPSVGDGEVYVRLYLDKDDENGEFLTNLKQRTGAHTSVTTADFITGGLVPGKTGIYSASVSVATTASVVYDRWFSVDPDEDSGFVMFHTGTIDVQKFYTKDYNTNTKYVTKITNLKSSYDQAENARFRVHIRDRNWNPNSYTRFTTDISSSIIDNAYYKVTRIQDNSTVIDYGTGSLNHTLLSYDSQGNYFDLDMSMFEKGYSYGIKLVYKRDTVYHEQPEIFKFRVE